MVSGIGAGSDGLDDGTIPGAGRCSCRAPAAQAPVAQQAAQTSQASTNASGTGATAVTSLYSTSAIAMCTAAHHPGASIAAAWYTMCTTREWAWLLAVIQTRNWAAAHALAEPICSPATFLSLQTRTKPGPAMRVSISAAEVHSRKNEFNRRCDKLAVNVLLGRPLLQRNSPLVNQTIYRLSFKKDAPHFAGVHLLVKLLPARREGVETPTPGPSLQGGEKG